MAESALQMHGDQLTHQSWLAKGSSWQDSHPSGSPEDQGQASLLANTHLHTQQFRASLSQSRCLMSLILMSLDSCIVQVEHEQVHCSPLKLHDDHHDLVLQTLSATATKSNHVSILRCEDSGLSRSHAETRVRRLASYTEGSCKTGLLSRLRSQERPAV